MRYIMAEHKRTLPSRKGDQKANKRVNESELAAESKQQKQNETTTVVQSVDFSGGQTAEMRRRLGEDFFTQPCVALAKAFLGKVLVRRREDGTELRGRVVETEAYLGGEDKASHSAGGKRTERNTAMFMKPGAIYVYPIYGVYLCMNVSSEGRDGAAVLLRSLEPLQGHSVMRQLRAARRKDGARPLKDKELCNGPSKLCQALDVPRRFDRRDLATDPEVWLEDADLSAGDAHDGVVVEAPRVGIESHGEWAKKPLRFYIRGNACVSVVDKVAERRENPPDLHRQNICNRTQMD
ncbi:DNA-3-methyladenine glycosylase isoform X1 [Phycodurus eques]|uniref:DNA-3-methyladenine glycosylase isoform X1 n=1 Tax=Phycodurus eques TaxID=693459 RepID=UPI002ACDF2A6|nr:DNA-3-methyladenine glycosylase isoform X1 [Phycodurus eques]